MIPKSLQDLLEELGELETSREKFGFLIELSQELPQIDVSKKISENKLNGCASNAWIDIEEKNKKIYIAGDAEAQISKGMLAFLSLGLSGSTKQEIQDIPEKFLEKNPVFLELSPSRHNGALSAITVIRQYCEG